MTMPPVRGEDDGDNNIVVDWRRHQAEIAKEEKRRSRLTPAEMKAEDKKREHESKARAIEQRRSAQRHRRQQRIKIFLATLFLLGGIALLVAAFKALH
jgi:hypothetical protein